jgi:hypothetical protein
MKTGNEKQTQETISVGETNKQTNKQTHGTLTALLDE